MEEYFMNLYHKMTREDLVREIKKCLMFKTQEYEERRIYCVKLVHKIDERSTRS